MYAKAITPILNVSSLDDSFAWFTRLGWKKLWQWQDSFGAVGSGECEIFLCQDGQGSRGRSDRPTTRGPNGNDGADKGVWMTIWVGDVDAVHRTCIEQGIEVTGPPTDETWHVREMHIRHPDGHVFRISKGLGG